MSTPKRCYSYVLPEGRTGFAVEHPCKARAGFCAPLFELDVAERVLREVATEAPEDDASG